MAKNYSKLRGRIIEKFGTQEAFAEAINRSVVYVSKKLNYKSAFSQGSIKLWADALDISSADIGDYFFEQKV